MDFFFRWRHRVEMWTEEDYQSGQNISRTKSITAVILENLGMLLSSSASLIYRCYKVIYYYVVVKRKRFGIYTVSGGVQRRTLNEWRRLYIPELQIRHKTDIKRKYMKVVGLRSRIRPRQS